MTRLITSLVLLLGLAAPSVHAVDVKLKLFFKNDNSKTCKAASGCDVNTLDGTKLKAIADGNLKACTTLTFAAAAPVIGSATTQFKTATCKTANSKDASQIILAASIPEAQAAAVKEFNEWMAGAKNTAATLVPQFTGFQLIQETATKNFPTPKQVAMELKNFICGDPDALLAGLAKTLGLTGKTAAGAFLNLQYKKITGNIVACPAGRRLLAATVSLEFILPGLSTAQLSLVNGAFGDGDFTKTLVANLGPKAGTPTVTLTEAGGGALQGVAGAKTFVPDSSAKMMHNFARLDGTNNIKDIAGSSSVSTAYLMGCILLALPCSLCLFYNMYFFCFQICCCRCCLDNKKRYASIKTPAMIAAVVFLFFTFIGWCLFMAGASGLTTAKDGIVGGGQEFLDYIDNMGTAIDAIKKTGKEISAELGKPIYNGCTPFLNLKEPLAADVANPLGSADVSMAKSVIDGYNSYNIIIVLLIVVATGLYFFMAICQAASTYFQLKQSGKCKCLQCCAKCSVCCAPCTIISLWVGGIICVIISAILGDMCVTDPLKGFVDLAKFEELRYFLTCQGKPLKAIVDAFVIFGAVAGVVDNVEGLRVLAENDAACRYKGGSSNDPTSANFDRVVQLIKAQGNNVLAIADKLLCTSFNPIGYKLVSEGLCHGLQYGTYFIWLGCFFIGLSLMVTTAMYVRVSNTNKMLRTKVAPHGNDVQMTNSAPAQNYAPAPAAAPAAAPVKSGTSLAGLPAPVTARNQTTTSATPTPTVPSVPPS